MATPTKAQILIASATWGSAVGICTGFSYSYTVGRVTVKDEASVEQDARGIVDENVVASVTFLHTPLTFSETAASLVIVTKNVDGGTTTHTIANVIPDSLTASMDRNSPPGSFTIVFSGKGAQSQPTVVYS